MYVVEKKENTIVKIRDVQMASGKTLSLYVKEVVSVKAVIGNIADYYRNLRDWVLGRANAYTDSKLGEAINSANAAAQSAARAAEQVNQMAEVIGDVKELKEEVQAAIDAANAASQAAEQAVEDVQAAIESQSLGFPTSMTVEYPARLTYGNIEEVKIKAVLYPLATALQNVIFLSDNKAVSVDPDGTIIINQPGRSRVHVIPTMKTSLAQTILINVEEPSVRLVDMSHVRLLANGNFRLS